MNELWLNPFTNKKTTESNSAEKSKKTFNLRTLEILIRKSGEQAKGRLLDKINKKHQDRFKEKQEKTQNNDPRTHPMYSKVIEKIISVLSGDEPTKINMDNWEKRNNHIKECVIIDSYNFRTFVNKHEELFHLALELKKRENLTDINWYEQLKDIETRTLMNKMDDFFSPVMDIESLSSASALDFNINLKNLNNALSAYRTNLDFSSLNDTGRSSLIRIVSTIESSEQNNFDHIQNNSFLSKLLQNTNKKSESLESSNSNFLTNRFKQLQEIQDFVIKELPQILSKPIDLVELHNKVLLRLEQVAEPLTYETTDPLLLAIEQETISLLNFARKKWEHIISDTWTLIQYRSQFLTDAPLADGEYTEEYTAIKTIIKSTDQLLFQVSKLNNLSESRIRATVKDIIYTLFAVEKNERNTPIIQYAEKIIQSNIFSDMLPSVIKEIDDQYPVLKSANEFLDTIVKFRDLQNQRPPNSHEIIEVYQSVKTLLEADTLPNWQKRRASEKITEAKNLMIPPTAKEEIQEWETRLRGLLEELKTRRIPSIELSPQSISDSEGINKKYFYQGEDIQELLKTYSKDFNTEDKKVTIGADVPDYDVLNSVIASWLEEEASTSTSSNTLVIPYSQINPGDFSNSNHWTVLLVHKNNSDSLSVFYIDPNQIKSNLPADLPSKLNKALSSLCRTNLSIGKKFKPQFNIVPVQHSAQEDAFSCGPRIVEDTKAMLDQ